MAQRTVPDSERAPGVTGARAPWPARAGRAARPAAAVAGGVLLYLAFPPTGLWFLTPIGVALLMLAVAGLPARRAALLGLLGGAAFLLPGLAWVRPIGTDAWLVLVAVECLFFGAMSAGLARVWRLPGRPLWAAALWVAQEWIRGLVPVGGFPWMRAAFSQGHSPFTPYAALGGAPLVSFAVALCGALLATAAVAAARAARRREPLRRAARPAAALAAGALAVPLLALAVPVPGSAGARTVRIGIVQGDVPGTGMGFLGDQPAVVLGNHARVTHELARAVRAGRLPAPQLVVWPENASDIDPYRSAEAHRVIDDAAADIGVPVLVGAVVRVGGDHRATRGVVWDPARGPGAYYDKQKLVPFGEYVPFRELFARFDPRVELVGPDSLPGTRPGALRVGPVTVGAVGCYEVAFDGVVRDTVRAGGTPLVVQTNNATYAFTGLPDQQLAMSQLRAVEHGRAVVTAATTGVSAYVDPTGQVRWRTAEKVADSTVVEVPVRTGQTLATRLGALPEWTLVLAAALALAAASRPRRPAAPAGDSVDSVPPAESEGEDR
ncbi:apolipoprotein N-acyltransferase [Sphaerisporangium rufum]|uniref:Apolipoprotein N-acyltransferase n=1 Tax=Sphaerisporangium rufum TaxID=1381558 RepID=A0A919R1K6_9ACTN|nr:apolipoprotein N-acyltransferase [Sphaerisporangium rufum]GII78066.1 apolipoprotein N-acyltransferase [Sphaerisporangium rufum]